MGTLIPLGARSASEARQRALEVGGVQLAEDRTLGPYGSLQAAQRVADENLWGPVLLCWYGEGAICWALGLPAETVRKSPGEIAASSVRSSVRRTRRTR